MTNPSFVPIPDEDIKIATPGKKSAGISEEEVGRALTEMEAIRRNGLLEKAKEIGGIMAQYAAGVGPSATSDLPASLRKIIARQQVFLCVFAVTVGCERKIENPTIARTALNSFHDAFRVKRPEIYDDSDYSVALSLYYLAVRSVGDSDEQVGKTFAMLLGDEKNQSFRAYGEATYRQCLEEIERLAGKLKTAEEQA